MGSMGYTALTQAQLSHPDMSEHLYEENDEKKFYFLTEQDHSLLVLQWSLRILKLRGYYD